RSSDHPSGSTFPFGTTTVTCTASDADDTPSSVSTTFKVTVVTPTIAGIAPNAATAGSGAFTLTVTGAGFVDGSTVLWNSSGLATTFVSPTQLTAAVPAVDLDVAGAASYEVTVQDPVPSGVGPSSA